MYIHRRSQMLTTLLVCMTGLPYMSRLRASSTAIHNASQPICQPITHPCRPIAPFAPKRRVNDRTHSNTGTSLRATSCLPDRDP
ncbi:hypothetical protein BD289DRAFT_178998 [Coniella lustricola]|uniref:Uncharacterized protein n=1 Tax=Coniella lustricola TaxID=2025994 RepID=A0A2T3ADQ4_9PEZI|nr:hypothetical protein BD289DRAFT_178998 [Coniella lustricola]